ncbi:hypothetical protein PHYPO_G00239230 [Pangasianodon hypophthalmus]|uniref:Uncharacterized protein n=1 Tax=Pangasianodon hypophthalmus TaxID=310915 RepID=A0A5N5NC80_PANHP|nr:uncharacterized protein LOC113523877 [Pangasianodon hypophthalmus]XP_026765733.1 uncharacterized protein LOC113523877 [Pangasianodon hypophthalmus]KAB5565270.1 hypothetical protein PHYPO_G00239230 [Pangasianodon hypophthalmus]
MAEIEEIVEGVEEAIEGAEEGIEELSEEVQEEIQAEIAETRTVIEELTTTESKLRGILKSLGSCVSDIAKFTFKNIAIGAILWGVNVALNKLLPQGHQQETKTKIRNVIKALSDVINAEAAINQKTLEWMKAHENDKITLDGIEVPMEAILTKYMKPLVEATDKSKTIAETLQEKVDGKIQFKCPTADDMRKFMEVTEVFIKAFTDLIVFILKHEDQVKVLQSFPVKEGDLVDLTAKLNVAKDLPLW